MFRVIVAVGLMGMPLSAVWADYSEVRELALPAEGLSLLDIEAGAGSLTVVGEAGRTDVVVEATISVDDDDDAARRKIESDVELTLEQRGDRAQLISRFESRLFGWRSQPRIDLEVRMPEGLDLTIDDGSGSVMVSQVSGDVDIDDGSGSLDAARHRRPDHHH